MNGRHCHRQAPSAEFSALISRAVTAILNPIGQTVCLKNNYEQVYQHVREYLLVNRLNHGSLHDDDTGITVRKLYSIRG